MPGHPCPYLTSPVAGPNQSSLRADSGPIPRPGQSGKRLPTDLLIKSCFKSVVGGCGGDGGGGVEKGSEAINDPPSQTLTHAGGVEKGSVSGWVGG